MLVVFLASTLKLPIQTVHSVAPEFEVFVGSLENCQNFSKNEHTQAKKGKILSCIMNCQDDIFLHSTINLNFQQGVKQWHFYNRLNTLLPPANVVCESYVFTGVCLSTGGVSQQGDPWEGGTPRQGDPPAGRPPWQGDPPEGGPPGRKTPHPPPWKEAPPGRETPRQGDHPPAERPPPPPPDGYWYASYWTGGTHPTGMHSCLLVICLV